MGPIDTDLLYRTLDAQRQARGLSWRDVARETGLSPSTFARLPALGPGLDGYVAMCRWLGMRMETFAERAEVEAGGGLESELVILLDRHRVPPMDRDVVLAVVRAYLTARVVPPDPTLPT